MRHVFIVMLAPCILAGCDPLHGVLSRAKLDSIADVGCVTKVLHANAAAKNVQYSTDTSETYQLLPHQGKFTTISHTWQYGEHGFLVLQIVGKPGSWDFTNGLTTVLKITDAQIARFEPVIERINREVDGRCHLPVGTLPVERL